MAACASYSVLGPAAVAVGRAARSRPQCRSRRGAGVGRTGLTRNQVCPLGTQGSNPCLSAIRRHQIRSSDQLGHITPNLAFDSSGAFVGVGSATRSSSAPQRDGWRDHGPFASPRRSLWRESRGRGRQRADAQRNVPAERPAGGPPHRRFHEFDPPPPRLRQADSRRARHPGRRCPDGPRRAAVAADREPCVLLGCRPGALPGERRPAVSGGVNDRAAFGAFGNALLESCAAATVNPDFPAPPTRRGMRTTRPPTSRPPGTSTTTASSAPRSTRRARRCTSASTGSRDSTPHRIAVSNATHSAVRRPALASRSTARSGRLPPGTIPPKPCRTSSSCHGSFHSSNHLDPS